MSSNSMSEIQAEPELKISRHLFMVVTTIDNSISKVCIHVWLSTISVLILRGRTATRRTLLNLGQSDPCETASPNSSAVVAH